MADSSSADQNELYLELGTAPTRENYQYRYSNLAAGKPEIVVPSAACGNLVHPAVQRQRAGPKQLRARRRHGSDHPDQPDSRPLRHQRPATLTLSAAGFDSMTAVQFVAADGTTYSPSSTLLISPTEMTAVFPAGSVPAGQYSVKVVEPSVGSSTLPNGFTMVQGGEPNLVTNVIVPNPIGYHIASTIYVEYSNTGNVAMPAPLLSLSATMNGQEGALHDAQCGPPGFRLLDLVHAPRLQPVGANPRQRCHPGLARAGRIGEFTGLLRGLAVEPVGSLPSPDLLHLGRPHDGRHHAHPLVHDSVELSATGSRHRGLERRVPKLCRRWSAVPGAIMSRRSTTAPRISASWARMSPTSASCGVSRFKRPAASPRLKRCRR